MNPSNYISDATAANFDTVVVEQSHHAPVLVDFWADWCGPCKSLAPLLDKLAEQYQGKFLVAKVDTEREQQLAAEHGIRSIPTLKMYKDGRVVEETQGVLPETSLRQLIERHIVRESDLLRKQAMELYATGDADGALAVLDKAAELDPDNYDIKIDQMRVYVGEQRLQEARALAQTLPLNVSERGDTSALLSELEFAEAVAAAPPLADLERRVQESPDDSEARYRLGARLVLQQQYESALEHFLHLLQRDRSYGDGAGRRGMIAVFNLLGGEGDLVSHYRRRMFNALH